MKKQLLAGVIVLIALLPLFYWYYLRPTLPAQIPRHYTNGHADGFTSQQWLRELAWLPVVLYLALTFIPQIHTLRFGWWRSHRQRQLRAVVVAAASCILLAILYRAGHTSLSVLP